MSNRVVNEVPGSPAASGTDPSPDARPDPAGGPRNAVVTGAGSGIGAEIAVGLAERGVGRVAVVDIDASAAEQVAGRIRAAGADALTVVADVGDAEAWEAALMRIDADLGGMDLLVNNAARLGGTPLFPDTAVERVRDVVLVNCLGVMVGTQTALRLMRGRSSRRGAGTVVNVSSGSAFRAYPEEPVYAATKAAIVHFTRCAAMLHPVSGVRVNSFAPPLTDTPLLATTGYDGPADWVTDAMRTGGAWSPRTVAAQAIELILDPTANGEIRMFRSPTSTNVTQEVIR